MAALLSTPPLGQEQVCGALAEDAAAKSACPPALVWRHHGAKYLFAIKRQASCLYQVDQDNLGAVNLTGLSFPLNFSLKPQRHP